MRRGERQVWREIARCTEKVAMSSSYAEEYAAKAEMRSAWASLYMIKGASGIPRSGLYR